MHRRQHWLTISEFMLRAATLQAGEGRTFCATGCRCTSCLSQYTIVLATDGLRNRMNRRRAPVGKAPRQPSTAKTHGLRTETLNSAALQVPSIPVVCRSFSCRQDHFLRQVNLGSVKDVSSRSRVGPKRPWFCSKVCIPAVVGPATVTVATVLYDQQARRTKVQTMWSILQAFNSSNCICRTVNGGKTRIGALVTSSRWQLCAYSRSRRCQASKKHQTPTPGPA